MSSITPDAPDLIAALASMRFCAGLSNEQVQAIARQMQVRPFTAGETLASAGDEVTEFWIVIEGELDTFVTDARGRERLLGLIRPGETVGEVAILENATTRSLRFTARTHGSLLAAPAGRLRAWIAEYPQLMQNLFATLSSRFKTVAGVARRGVPSPRLGIVAASPRAAPLMGRLATRLIAAGERLRVWAPRPDHLRSTPDWPADLLVHELSPDDTPLLEPPTPDLDRKIVFWSPGSDGRANLRQLRGCDEVLWLLEPRDAATIGGAATDWSTLPDDTAAKLRLVWLLDSNTPVSPPILTRQTAKPDLKVPIESGGGVPTRLERQGLDRLVRAVRGYSIGLALAGGGAKGMAHLGVLHELEQAGVSFDVMSGTSAGAMAGILYASGMSPESAIENFQRDLTPSRLFRYLPKWPNWYLMSQYRRRAWDAKLRKYLHDWRLEQLPIPFHAVTVDLVQVSTVVRRAGDAVHAILESINLPVVSKPILRNGMALVDGGVLNNLPADVLAESGADFVVGVDVSSRVRPEFAGNRPDMPTERMRNAGALDTLFRIFESLAHNMGKFRNRAVDFWIKPDTSRFGLAEFHRTAEIADAGKAAARDAMAELKQRLVELEAGLIEQSGRRC
jgi:predicted acylesterase/phospholipase RssA/CRP-like cAMP-binding protein